MIEADFPSTLPAFLDRFGDEGQCRDYLARQKWPDGFRCRTCNGDRAHYLPSRKTFECAACGHQESLIAGTMFQQTKKPLREWFLAIFYVSASKGGVSAAELQRLLGMGSYQTAWSWLHKIRQAMVHPRRQPLSGEVEIDESYLGAPQSGKRGRGAAGKTIVAGAVEKRGKGSGRVRLGVLENVRAETLKAFLSAGVSPTTTAHTDGWRGYSKLDRSGYRHVVSVIHGSGADGVAHLPRVHLVFSLLKRWLLGTHHGAVSTKHLPAYLEEYTFRFNRRTAKSITHRFQRVVEQAVMASPKPYWEIVGRTAPTHPLQLAA